VVLLSGEKVVLERCAGMAGVSQYRSRAFRLVVFWHVVAGLPVIRDARVLVSVLEHGPENSGTIVIFGIDSAIKRIDDAVAI
jgi:hypothetical protein